MRPATAPDVPALEALIPLSVHALQAGCYTAAQRAAALGPVFGVDRELIRDGTCLVVEDAGRIIGCGAWSRRRALFGGDAGRAAEDAPLDPAREPARIRAFFVHPAWARRGVGRSLLAACEAAAVSAGFRRAELVATLAGEPLYTTCGYVAMERFELPLRDGLRLPVVQMAKALS